MDSLKYGVFFFRAFPTTLVLLQPLGPLLNLYSTVPMFPLIMFFCIYIFLISNSNMSNFVRYNACQAIILDLVLVIPSMVEWALRGPGASGGTSLMLKKSAYNAIWLFAA